MWPAFWLTGAAANTNWPRVCSTPARALVTTWFRNSGRSGVRRSCWSWRHPSPKTTSRVPRRPCATAASGVGSALDTAELKELSTQPYSDNVLGVTTYVLLTKRLCRGNVPCHGSVRNTTLYPDYYTNGNVVRFSRWTVLGIYLGNRISLKQLHNAMQLQSKLCTRQTIHKFDALLNFGVFRARPTCNVSKVARKHATLPNCCHIVMGHIYCVGSNSVHDNLTICKQCSIGAITLLEGRFATQRDTRYI